MANTKNFREQGGEKWVVGGVLDIASGGSITAGGTQAAAIADVTAVSGTYVKAEIDAIVGAVNDALEALRGAGIIAE